MRGGYACGRGGREGGSCMCGGGGGDCSDTGVAGWGRRGRKGVWEKERIRG